MGSGVSVMSKSEPASGNKSSDGLKAKEKGIVYLCTRIAANDNRSRLTFEVV